ncbi:MAG: amidohydrolase, partial [Microlunatus sp.]
MSTPTPPTTIVRNVRIVGVGAAGSPPSGPVDLKIVSDRITQIEQAEVAGQQSRGLATQDADLVLDADGRWAIPG